MKKIENKRREKIKQMLNKTKIAYKTIYKKRNYVYLPYDKTINRYNIKYITNKYPYDTICKLNESVQRKIRRKGANNSLI